VKPTHPEPRAAAKTDRTVAADDSLPVRKAEPVRESSSIKPNKDPKRVAAPPATLAAAQASRLSSATASNPPKAAAKRPAVAADSVSRSNSPTAKPKARMHTVAEGETAYRIARTYNVDVDRLIKANGIKPESLRPGTELVIPAADR
jgi:LysM repeat protein